MERKKLTIGHLFPELLNMYGDKGNVLSLKNRLVWRGMDVDIVNVSAADNLDFNNFDIVILGGGSDREQKLAFDRLQTEKQALCEYVESDGVLLGLCGAYPMLGKTFFLKGECYEGLGILDIYTEDDGKRHIGDVVIESCVTGEKTYVVGFENHSGKTRIGTSKPFGVVRHGFGNNGEDSSCGAIYKNLIGTYLHGPLLPKNPGLTDYVLSQALLRKYGEDIQLSPLCDRAENEAHDYIVNKFLK